MALTSSTSKQKNKPTIAVDFDGVIHRYSKGWQDGTIYDDSVIGFFQWLLEAVPLFKVVVHSSRFTSPEKMAEAREWLGYQSIRAINTGEVPEDTDWVEVWNSLELSATKPPAWITIDDRCVVFNGDWWALQYRPENLAKFRPWTAR